MSYFPAFIAFCIAAVFFGAATSTGRDAVKRTVLGYIQLFFWWPVTIYYFHDLLRPEPDRMVVLPPFYSPLVHLILPLLYTACFTFPLLVRGASLFTRVYALAAGWWIMIDWFYLALAYPFDAPKHDYVILWSSLKPLAAANGCALAVAALALAWHAINPEWGKKAAGPASLTSSAAELRDRDTATL